MNKKVLLVVLGVLLCLALGVGVSYAYYLVTVKQSNSNVVKSSCLSLEITNEANVIKLEKQIPIMNSEGKDLTPYTFTITNTCSSFISYSLNLEELEGSTLASKYIMTMVNDKSYVNMSSLSSTDKYYDSSVEARVLVTGSLGAKASVDYSLRLWMDENTPLTSEAMNKSFRSKIVVVATPTKTVDFDYTGTEQIFTAPVSGKYKLETCGAQGGYAYSEEASGGYGGYSVGNLLLNSGDSIYITVGGKGDDGIYYNKSEVYIGGYNGGGNALSDGATTWGAGGGATSIQNILIGDGQLKNYENNQSNVLMVSGAGGGGGWYYMQYLLEPTSSNYLPNNGGAGGGYIGVNGKTRNKSLATGGTQTSGGVNGGTNFATSEPAFGIGGNYVYKLSNSGGGAGWYGGGSAFYWGSSGAGGSGYIGNSLLTNKAMYCYNCEESNEEDTKTISTTCAEEVPTEKCAKKGNGYAKITYIGSN